MKKICGLVCVLMLCSLGVVTFAAETPLSEQINTLLNDINSISTDIINIPVADLPSDALSIPYDNTTTGESCLVLTRALSLGARDTLSNKEVSLLQAFLVKKGFLKSSVTGYYGPLTEQAVHRFQIAYSVITSNDTNIYPIGTATRLKIKNLTCAPSSDTTGGSASITLRSKNTQNPTGISFNNAAKVGLGDQAEATLEVVVPTGKTIRYMGLDGIDKPFSYKGGAFPGIGGTCSQTITTNCTLVLTYTPREKLGTSLSKDTLQSDEKITFRYTDAKNEESSSNEFLLRGYTEAPAELFYGDGKTSVVTDAEAIFPGGVKQITFDLLSYGRVTNVTSTAVNAPFFATSIENKCEDLKNGGISYGAKCSYVYEFRPTTAGHFTSPLTVTYSDGVSIKTLQLTLAADAISSSDFTVTPENNLLVVYNDQSSDGKKIADYYIQNRPGFRNINVLAISYPAKNCSVYCGTALDEIASIPAFEQAIKKPIYDWMANHKDKEIRHVVLVRGIPTRVYLTEPPQAKVVDTTANSQSTQALLASPWIGKDLIVCNAYSFPTSNLRFATPLPDCGPTPSDKTLGFYTEARYPGTRALFTLLDMGSLDATLHYIDKLKEMYNSMREPSIFISASNANRGGSTYYFEDINYVAQAQGKVGEMAKNALRAANPDAKIDYRPYGSSYLKNPSNVKGFLIWGGNSPRGGSYTTDVSDSSRTLNFSGNSNWYLIQTVESFNGERNMTYQGTYLKWFAEKAFGGNNYSNTPVAAVAHVDEPSLIGINSPFLFPCWERGNLFIDCAWYSRKTPMMMAVGDPWVRN